MPLSNFEKPYKFALNNESKQNNVNTTLRRCSRYYKLNNPIYLSNLTQ